MQRMKIISVVVTCNRLTLLSRALNSIVAQCRNSDFTIVVSNSEEQNYEKEKVVCEKYGFVLLKNVRTKNYAGALNTAIEEIVNCFGIGKNIYFASLDDDDEWLPDYLREIESHNTENYDLLAGNILRICPTKNELMALPMQLSEKDFLTGNPGIFGSNTFVRLETLLFSGCFDESLPATVDRDFFVRCFQQNPKYKIIGKHLVNQYADDDRARITTSGDTKKRSLQIFFYKYQHLMNETDKEKFFARANKLFSMAKEEFADIHSTVETVNRQDIVFKGKGNYQFIIGFIAGDETITERIVRQIIEKEIPVDLLLIIDNTPQGQTLFNCQNLLTSKNILHKIIRHNEWQSNLATGHYGSIFKPFATINSIPLGRTILHHHLYTATIDFARPVYWIIDDDISFTATTTNKEQNVNLFEIVKDHIDNADGIIGGISSDPPVPVLSCVRSQLVDFLHSHFANNSLTADYLNIQQKLDYYYDLSDIHGDHLEMPIYHQLANEKTLNLIFSGKSISRPALQQELKSFAKTATKRGANTLVFNRDLLHYYPVINLEIDNRFARRGDLLWSLLNQVVSGKKILEHTFSIDHNRPKTEFVLTKELQKSAYDIIGYAFNKAILQVINEIKAKSDVSRPTEILRELNNEIYYERFLSVYHYFLARRKTRFLMNYYRIIGLTNLLSKDFLFARKIYSEISDTNRLQILSNLLNEAQKESNIKQFFSTLISAMWGYSYSITKITEDSEKHKTAIKSFWNLESSLRELGKGAEGVVFTDEKWVYKSFYDISENEWNFLKDKSDCFANHCMLAEIECFEKENFKFVRYPYLPFQSLQQIDAKKLVSLLRFFKSNKFVFTNIKPQNFIQTQNGQAKLIDYGKSFEPYTVEKLLNATKRAYLLWKYPTMGNDGFHKLTALINQGVIPEEIDGWERFWYAINPRTKEEILDAEIISIFKKLHLKKVWDYGAGKCRTARQIEQSTNAKVFVYDIDTPTMEKYGKDFSKYEPNTNHKQKFDAVLLNIVLCVVDDSVVDSILSNISNAILPNGKLIVSICNPDFAHIKKMEFQNRDFVPLDISKEDIITKTCIYTGNQKIEYHRPTNKYLELFTKYGFETKQIIDTKGVDIETLKYASDFKIFILNKL
jgi:serine/threonine protein kinase